MYLDADKKQILTVSNIRNVNISNMMHDLIKDKSKTRNELSKKNKISLMTVKHIVDDLINMGIVMEKSSDGNEVGRKPKVLEIAKAYGNIVCINLTSAEEISFLLYDIYGNLLKEQLVSFKEEYSYKENLLKGLNVIKETIECQETINVGVAVFVPSAYYEDVDLVNYDLIPDFKELHMKELFVRELGTERIFILHDVVSAAHSEYDSLNPTMESQFYFYCGYGVGGFFIHQGAPIVGAELMAGEVGKMILPSKENNKQFVTFEELVSVQGIQSSLKLAGIKKSWKELLNEENLTSSEEKVVKEVLDVIVRILYNLLWVYNPDRLVIDSCYSEYSIRIIRHFRNFIASLENEAIPIKVEIRQALYNEYHIMRGCFQIVRQSWVEDIASARKEEIK